MPELIDLITSNFDYDNFFSAQLTAPMTASDTDIFLDAVPTPSEGVLVIDWDVAASREVIFYNSKTASKVTCPSVANGRGFDDSTATTHLSGANVIMAPVRAWFRLAQQLATTSTAAWKPLGYTPDTITNNGNNNYTLVFNSVDLTSFISDSMKLRLERASAAPTQCADLEASSSQYFSKTTPAGCTFTTAFTTMAWVKPESYTNGAIISRTDGTSGWFMEMDVNGAIRTVGDAGATIDSVSSYRRLRLNKWQHVATTMDMTGSALVYINGELVDSVAASATAALVQAGNLQVGARNSTVFFDGKIAQAAVFSSILTAATIRSYMSQGLIGTESTLVSAYSLNGTLNDLNTTNANNLTASGGAAATNADTPFNDNNGTNYEFAQVVDATFATNTTLTVQAAPNCAIPTIPTSGALASVSYSTEATPYLWPRIATLSSATLTNKNHTAVALSNSSQDLISSGLVVGVYAPFEMIVECTIAINAGSTSDFEFRPEIRVDNASVATMDSVAAAGFASSRATTRTFTSAITLTAGYHEISGGVFFSSGTSLTWGVGSGYISVTMPMGILDL